MKDRVEYARNSFRSLNRFGCSCRCVPYDRRLRCVAGADRYRGPYRPATELHAEAQGISDRLDTHIRGWLAGTGDARIPDELIPSATQPGYENWRLIRYEDIRPEDQWVVRPAEPVDLDRLHSLFPDPNATYLVSWGMIAPFGYKVVVEGDFPHARFFDIQTIAAFEPGQYNSGYNGAAELPIVDVDVPTLPGHTNPFKVGADRNAAKRSYRAEFELAMGDPVELNRQGYAPPYRDPMPKRFASGIMNIGPLGRRHTLGQAPLPIRVVVGNPRGEWAASEMWVRYYAPNKAKGPLAGVQLPKMYYQTPEGQRFFIAYDDTEAERTANRTERVDTARTYPDPDAPIGADVGWSKLYGIFRSGLDIMNGIGWITPEGVRRLDYAYAGRADNIAGPGGYESSKTLVPYTNYLVRDMAVARGKVAILTGKMPTFPQTREGQRRMTGGQMRYWSITNQNVADALKAGQALGSVMDDEVCLDDQRRYVIVYSQPQDRPANATCENGVTWVRWAPVNRQGLMLRWMSVEPDWAFDLTPDEELLPPAAVKATGTRYDPSLIGRNSHDGVLGTYLPKIGYMTKDEFEAMGRRVGFDSIPDWD